MTRTDSPSRRRVLKLASFVFALMSFAPSGAAAQTTSVSVSIDDVHRDLAFSRSSGVMLVVPGAHVLLGRATPTMARTALAMRARTSGDDWVVRSAPLSTREVPGNVSAFPGRPISLISANGTCAASIGEVRVAAFWSATKIAWELSLQERASAEHDVVREISRRSPRELWLVGTVIGNCSSGVVATLDTSTYRPVAPAAISHELRTALDAEYAATTESAQRRAQIAEYESELVEPLSFARYETGLGAAYTFYDFSSGVGCGDDFAHPVTFHESSDVQRQQIYGWTGVPVMVLSDLANPIFVLESGERIWSLALGGGNRGAPWFAMAFSIDSSTGC